MNTSNNVEQKRLALLDMALVMCGGQAVTASELILDAEALNGWVIGVDYAADGTKDRTVSYPSRPVGFDLLQELSNDYKMKNYQNAGQFKTIALVSQNNKEYRCLLVAFYSSSRIEYLDYCVFSSSFDVANSLEHIICPHSIVFCGSARFVELLERKKIKRVCFIHSQNGGCFAKKNKERFKSERAYALWHVAHAVKNGELLSIHPVISEEIKSILSKSLIFSQKKALIDFPKMDGMLSEITEKILDCLCLLFSERIHLSNFE
ncbi:MAG: hypothetical protein RJA86_1919 [Pseudomonadota bacterium]|jgi:hypothetical protein